jgi:hypothetical protein
MISTIITELKTKILTLGLTERFGGLVQPVTQDLDGNRFTFPISCDVSGKECFETGKYADLVPNSSYKSVLYFEQIGDMGQPEYVGPKRNALKWSATLRLVGWLNLDKLGETDCAVTDQVVYTIIDKVLENNGQYSITNAAFTNATMNVRMDRIVKKSPDIFRNYTYSEFVGNLVYPFDYFAVDFDVDLIVPKSCIIAYTPSTPIACIETY